MIMEHLGCKPAATQEIERVSTDANGYYLFDRLQPGSNYYVHIPIGILIALVDRYNIMSAVLTPIRLIHPPMIRTIWTIMVLIIQIRHPMALQARRSQLRL